MTQHQNAGEVSFNDPTKHRFATVQEALVWLLDQSAQLDAGIDKSNRFFEEQITALTGKAPERPLVIDAGMVTVSNLDSHHTVGGVLAFLLEQMQVLITSQENTSRLVDQQLEKLRARRPERPPILEARSVTLGGATGFQDVASALQSLFEQAQELATQQERLQEMILTQLQTRRPERPPILEARSVTLGGATGYQDVASALQSLIAQVQTVSATQTQLADFVQSQLLEIKNRQRIPPLPVIISAEGVVFQSPLLAGARDVEAALSWAVERLATLTNQVQRFSQMTQEQLVTIRSLWEERINELRLTLMAEIAVRMRPLAISSASNPGLQFDSSGRLFLDLDRKGSFDDSVAALGAGSIQQAIERLAQIGQVSSRPGNLLRQETDGLYVPELAVTTTPDVRAVSRKNGTLNLSPAVIAHRRGQVVIDKPDAWVKVETLDTRVWDTLSEVGQAMAPLNQPNIIIRRTGYYLCDAPVRGGAETSIVVNGKILEVGRHYGLLGEGSEVGLAVRTGGNGNYSGEFDLFVKLMD